MNVPLAITRSLIDRQRFGISLAAGYLLLSSAAFMFLTTKAPTTLLVLGAAMSFFAILYIVSIVIHPDSDVASARSTYPPHYFTLPVKTRDLVLWPMALATGFMFVTIWLLSAGLQKIGLIANAFWPATMAAAGVAMLQAVYWYPIGIPYSKLVLTLMVAVALVVMGPNGHHLGMTDIQKIEVFLGLTIASYLVAAHGLVKARRGDARELTLSRQEAARPTRAFRFGRPFGSPARAQLWFEMRQHGKILPFLVGIILVLFAVPLKFSDTVTPMYDAFDTFNLMPTVPTYLQVNTPYLLAMIPLIAWIVGAGARPSEVKKEGEFHLYFTTRPLSDWSLAATKLKAVFLSSLVTWLLVGLFTAVILVTQTGGFDNGETIKDLNRYPLWEVLGSFKSWDYWSGKLAFVTLAAYLTWRNYAVGIWTELSGKRWIKRCYPVSLLFALALVVASTSSWRQFAPLEVLMLVAYSACVLVVLKLILGFALLKHQIRHGLIRVREAGWVVGIYAMSSIVLYKVAMTAAGGVFSGMLDEGNGKKLLTILITALVFLWIPFVRVLLATSALSANRHR